MSLETCPPVKLDEHLSPRVMPTVLITVSVVSMVTQSSPPSTAAEMLSFFQRTFGCQSKSSVLRRSDSKWQSMLPHTLLKLEMLNPSSQAGCWDKGAEGTLADREASPT